MVIIRLHFLVVACLFVCRVGFGQTNRPYTASFIGRMGVDTVLVETYTMVNNHLYGKAFVRVPEDYIGEFSIHFYPDGSIREFNVVAMDPFNSSVPFQAKSGAFEYRLNMNCRNDTCTFYNSEKGKLTETIFKHAASKMDFVGGWVPLISLIEWNCLRLVQSGKKTLPLKMINHNLGVFPIGVRFLAKDSIAFGGPFLEYTKIKVDQDGRIRNTNGIDTPWSYVVTKHQPINVDEMAAKMARRTGIGLPSPTATVQAVVGKSKIEVQYGRPFKRGRMIFGGVVPFDSLWRTGAGSPTILTLGKDIKMGQSVIPKGQYSLYTIPGKKEWILIFNTDLKTWPTDPNRRQDFVRVSIPIEKVEILTEQFTIDVRETAKGGLLQFAWDDTKAVAAFDVIEPE